ncbi:MAG: winged helix-turn-helix transcriptional regulator [Candidatus Helarchaeota archaeon]
MGKNSEIVTSINPNTKSKGRKNIRGAILNLLKESNYGLNFAQIGESLNLSRNTVKKYIYTFKKENLIEIKEIGRSKICFIKKKDKKHKIGLYRRLFFDFIRNLIEGLEKIAPIFSITDLKSFLKLLGNEMGKNTNFPRVEDVDINSLIKNRRHFLYYAVDISKQFLELYNRPDAKMIKVEAVPSNSSSISSILLRVENLSGEFGDSELFYHLWAGFYEIVLRENFVENLNLNVVEYQKENACCYFELSLD